MKLTKWQLYFLGMLVIMLPFLLMRMSWLNSSIKTKAVVLYIEETRLRKGGPQTYPVFRYYTEDDYKITSAGNYNLDYKEGDSVNIRYDPKENTSFKVDTLWGCWKDLMYYFSPILLFVTMIFCARDIVPKLIYLKRKKALDRQIIAP
jgi:hypothetical protein